MIEAIEHAKDKKFVWGEHDCCLFMADIVKAMTDMDPAEGMRGKCHDEKSAARYLKKKAGGLKEMLDQVFGDRIDPKIAQRGDVMVFDSELGETVGVCVGVNIVSTTPDGVVYVNRNTSLHAWRV